MNPLDARERVQLCARFEELGPEAPTLCDGWTTFDLAAHLVVRERNPVAGPGILLGDRIGALGRATAAAMAKEKRRGYERVVERVRTGPPIGPFAVPGLRTQINLVEYAVHHEDVRRANGLQARTGVADLQDALWPLLLRLGRFAIRGAPAGVAVTLVRPGSDGVTVRRGEREVVAAGDPLELLLWLYGRGAHAAVAFEAGHGASEDDLVGVKGAHLTI